MIPNSSYDITGWRSGGRQSLTYNLKAGQMRGMGTGRIVSNNIFINNYAPMPMHTAVDMHCCGGGGMSGFEKWMLGIGGVGSILGAIFGALGIGGGGGAPAEGAGDSGDKKVDVSPKPAKTEEAETTENTEDTPEVKTRTNAHSSEVDNISRIKEYSAFQNGKKMRCHDASGNTADIYGTLSNVVTDQNGVPQSFTLTDDESGNTYQYEVKVGSDGKLTYECISKGGAKTIGAPTYTYQNGQLINESNQNGYGFGIQTE